MDHFSASCDVCRIAHYMREIKVLERGDLQKMAPDVDLTSTNTNLYILLNNDPSLAKLKALSKALREDHTHGCHEELANRIYRSVHMYSDNQTIMLTFLKHAHYIQYMHNILHHFIALI